MLHVLVARFAQRIHQQVQLCQARIVLGLVTTFGRCTIQATHSVVGAVSAVDGFGQRWGRNGEFCVSEGPATRTSGNYKSVKITGCYSSVIGSNHCWLKNDQEDELRNKGLHHLLGIFYLVSHVPCCAITDETNKSPSYSDCGATKQKKAIISIYVATHSKFLNKH